ncbi:hypothetical protein EI94DRAFT_1701072, partial [Lactarius quietus]
HPEANRNILQKFYLDICKSLLHLCFAAGMKTENIVENYEEYVEEQSCKVELLVEILQHHLARDGAPGKKPSHERLQKFFLTFQGVGWSTNQWENERCALVCVERPTTCGEGVAAPMMEQNLDTGDVHEHGGHTMCMCTCVGDDLIGSKTDMVWIDIGKVLEMDNRQAVGDDDDESECGEVEVSCKWGQKSKGKGHTSAGEQTSKATTSKVKALHARVKKSETPLLVEPCPAQATSGSYYPVNYELINDMPQTISEIDIQLAKSDIGALDMEIDTMDPEVEEKFEKMRKLVEGIMLNYRQLSPPGWLDESEGGVDAVLMMMPGTLRLPGFTPAPAVRTLAAHEGMDVNVPMINGAPIMFCDGVFNVDTLDWNMILITEDYICKNEGDPSLLLSMPATPQMGSMTLSTSRKRDVVGDRSTSAALGVSKMMLQDLGKSTRGKPEEKAMAGKQEGTAKNPKGIEAVHAAAQLNVGALHAHLMHAQHTGAAHTASQLRMHTHYIGAACTAAPPFCAYACIQDAHTLHWGSPHCITTQDARALHWGCPHCITSQDACTVHWGCPHCNTTQCTGAACTDGCPHCNTTQCTEAAQTAAPLLTHMQCTGAAGAAPTAAPLIQDAHMVHRGCVKVPPMHTHDAATKFCPNISHHGQPFVTPTGASGQQTVCASNAN